MAAARIQIILHRPVGQTGPGTVSWRLLAVNNRDLGRAAYPYPDQNACRAAVRQLQDRAGELRVVTVRTGPSTWRWRIVAGDAVVAVSSREYQRRINADHAGRIVLVLIPDAQVAGPESSSGMSRLGR